MNSLQKKQRGAALLVSLVLLLLLTILALTSARTAMLQQRMSSGLQQQNLAFQAAENGIGAAVLRLKNNSAQWPLEIGDKKMLCEVAGGYADWSSTACSSSHDYRYEVAVERVSCANEKPDICFNITSTGIHLDTVVKHQQGYIFPDLCRKYSDENNSC